MKAVFAKGFLNAVISILGASLIIFVISRWSGDPVSLMLPMDAPQSAVDALKRGLEDVFVGDIAQDIRERFIANPKALEREL